MSLRFTVVSYNIHGCVGRDRTRDADRVAGILRGLEADIIGLQEVDTHSGPGLDSAQMDYLPHATGLHAARGPLLARHHGHYGNLLLTPFPILAVRHIDLSIGRHEPRGALDVDVRLPQGVVRVVVTHFGLLPWERRAQALRLMATLKQPFGAPLVVMGDFNEWLPFSRSLHPLHETLHGAGKTPATYPAFFPVLPLDRIFVSPAEARIELTAETTHVTRICSDHLPLRAMITLPERASPYPPNENPP